MLLFPKERVTWKMNTLHKACGLIDGIVKLLLFENRKHLSLSKILVKIQIIKFLLNDKVKNYETKLSAYYCKDQFPTINVNNAPDSLKVAKNYVLGQISDDYGLSKLQVVYYEREKPQTARRGTIAVEKSAFDQFIFVSVIPVEQGVSIIILKF
jgi:hypothetical protein